MKFLKKTFAYILPAMMVLGGATACTDFIEIDPENKVPEQGVDFTNKNNMYQPVVGAYSKVRTQGMRVVGPYRRPGRCRDLRTQVQL